MTIFVIGMSYETASAALREQLYFPAEKVSLYLQDILNKEIAREVLLLSTCNRSELYVEADQVAPIEDWFYAQATIEKAHFQSALYVYQQERAIAHIMQVACGLDSMVLGETQIAGQMKTAFSEAAAVGGIGTIFYRLFQQVFTITKEIRNTTVLGACPESIASTAIQRVKQHYDSLDQINIVLLGSGETARLLLHHLQNHVVSPIVMVSRNVDNARKLMCTWTGKGTIYSLDEIACPLCTADVVFTATGSLVPLLTREMIAKVIQGRCSDKPLLLMDIAVPRDVESSVAELPNVTLYNIDDLKTVIAHRYPGHQHAANKAYEMIRQKSTEFLHELAFMELTKQAICAYRQQAEAICRAELNKAEQKLELGMTPAMVLKQFSRILMNKLLHHPCVRLRQAGLEGEYEFLQTIKQLFALSDIK